MGRRIRRLLLLLILGGAGATAVRAVRRREQPPAPVGPSSEWPPLVPQAVPITAGAVGDVAAEAGLASDIHHTPMADRDWVDSMAGDCPIGHPIKANDNSHIYHVPGGRFYSRTSAERCYATEEAAQRDGYRRSKA